MREKRGDTSWEKEFLPFLMAGFYIDFISSFTTSMVLFALFLGLFQFGLLSLCSSFYFFGEFDLIFIYFNRIFFIILCSILCQLEMWTRKNKTFFLWFLHNTYSPEGQVRNVEFQIKQEEILIFIFFGCFSILQVLPYSGLLVS